MIPIYVQPPVDDSYRIHNPDRRIVPAKKVEPSELLPKPFVIDAAPQSMTDEDGGFPIWNIVILYIA